MARRPHQLAPVPGVDVRPAREALADRRHGLRIRGLEVLHRLVGEHDAPAERVVGLVLLVDVDARRGQRLLEQQREVEPGGAAADAGDLHARPRILGTARTHPSSA